MLRCHRGGRTLSGGLFFLNLTSQDRRVRRFGLHRRTYDAVFRQLTDVSIPPEMNVSAEVEQALERAIDLIK